MKTIQETTKKKSEVMAAFARGEKILSRPLANKRGPETYWVLDEVPSWNWSEREYVVMDILTKGDEPKVEIQWPEGTTADDWERMTNKEYLPKKGDLKVWVKEYEGIEAGNTMVIESDFVFNVFGMELGGILHIYRRKRVAKMPDVPVWWLRREGHLDTLITQIWDNSFGHEGWRYNLASCFDVNLLWSPDRKTWYNFYGEEIK